MIKHYIYIILFSTLIPAQNSFFELSDKTSHTKQTIRFNINDLDSEIQSINKQQKTSYSFIYYIEEDIDYSFDYEVKNTLTINNHSEKLNNLELSLFHDQIKVEINEAKFRGIKVLTVLLHPITYNNSTKTLNLSNSVDITINLSGEANGSTFKRSAIFDNMLKDYIINYDQIYTDRYQKPSILYICGGSSENSSSFRELKAWRHRQGFVVNSVSTSQTGTSTTSIKNYISEAYHEWENPPEFVCFIGDANGSYAVPTYVVSEGNGWNGAQGEGDFPYSLIDGNDLFPEVIVGRMSIRSNSELNTVVNKIIKYEKAEGGTDWLESVALVGDPYTASGISPVITNEYIEQLMDSYGMEDIRTKYSGNNFDDWMVDQINDGISFLNYRGIQGFSNFTSNDVNQLNNGYKLPLITTITCATGSFLEESTCISEALFRAGSSSNPAGAVGVIGTSTSYTHTAFNNIVDMGIYEGIFVKGAVYAGEALSFGRLALLDTYPENPNNNNYLFATWNNLMGDPATQLWTDTPSYVAAIHSDQITSGSNFFEVRIVDENDNYIEGARVTLLKGDDEIFETTTTDFNGSASFNLNSSSTGTVYVTATCHNCVPSESNFTINASESNLETDVLDSIADDGNNDGYANPGEIVNPSIQLHNNGVFDLSNISVVLKSNSNFVQIINSSENDINISAGDSYIINNLSFLVSENTPDIEDLGLFCEITDSDNKWIYSLDIFAYSANLHFNTLIIDDENNNSILDKGEIATIDIVVTNNGSIDLSGVSGTITNYNDQLMFTTNNLFWGDISQDHQASLLSSIEVTADSDLVNGTIFNIPIEIQSQSSYSEIVYLPITVGVVSEFDPVGPDSYGYYIYGTEDTDYEQAPVYDWFEIDPDYGGNGNILYIDDNGDNQDESVVIDLPFDFTFYGVEYDEITVCSNGWISFGDSNMASFRNYHLPGPGGPSPMIAVFWDDLKTNSGGDVVSYYDSVTEQFIIQWSDVRTYQYNDVQTFQLILYNDGWMSPNGDGSIKLQYKEFNNTTNGYYPVGNNGGAVIHGAYASIGIENQFGNDGIEYSYDNEYPHPGAISLSDESALFITAQSPGTFAAPSININTDEINFIVEENQESNFDIMISNNGEDGSMLFYSIDESPFLQPFSDNDTDGYTWSHSNVDQSIDYNWIDDNGFTELEFEDNDIASSPIDLGFDFEFYEIEYSSCIVNPNGWIGFGEDNVGWNNLSIYDEDSPRNAILGFWDDLNPSQSGNAQGSGIVKYKSFDDKFIVWYDNVIHWTNDERIYSFQIVINRNGTIDINYQSLEGSVTSATAGIINTDGTLGHQIVNNSDLLESNMSIQFSPETSWILLSSIGNTNEGNILFGDTAVYNVEVSALNLGYGVYTSNIIIESNADDIIIPVTMNVGDIDNIIYGDLNQDGLVDILDIVRQISIIMGDGIPTSYEELAGDINQDGVIDILDVVLAIGIIIQ